MIPRESIEAVMDALRVEEVVGDFVPLQRRGINLIGLCPFHGERTPSFNVSPTRGIYKCFGCGEGGNAVNFVMKHENYSYPEAIRYLARKYNIDLKETEASDEYKAEQAIADGLYIVNEFAAQHFQKNMWETDYGQNVGLAYFEERGLRHDVIRRFGLGFAMGQQGDLVSTMASQKFDADLVRQAGLMNKYGGDFFRLRVMFPFYNLTGKVVGFGGRVLSTADKSQPKYLNTPETPVYNKSKSLYGLFQAKKAIAQKDECLLTEGYMDVIALHQAGFENAVASSGTSLTVGQIQMIKRYTKNITILYDGDAAGMKAALRGLDMVLEQDMDVKIVSFPEGDDPDSYVRKVGETAFAAHLKSAAKDFLLFIVERLAVETEKDPIERARAWGEIARSLAKLDGDHRRIKRDFYVRACAALFDVNEQSLIGEVNRIILKGEISAEEKLNKTEEEAKLSFEDNTKPIPSNPFYDPTAIEFHRHAQGSKRGGYQERDIVRLLVLFGDRVYDPQRSIALYVLENMLPLLDEFDNLLYKEIVELYLQALERNEMLESSFFVQHERTDFSQLAVQMLAEVDRYQYSPNWERFNVFLNTQKMPEENHIKDVTSGVARFKIAKIQRLIDKNQAKLRNAGDLSPEDMTILLYTHQQLWQMRNTEAKAAGTVVLK